jgi:hypothetical protein
MQWVSDREAAASVRELRRVISVYEGVDVLPPDSRLARQLERARRAIAAYDALCEQLGASDDGASARELTEAA